MLRHSNESKMNRLSHMLLLIALWLVLLPGAAASIPARTFQSNCTRFNHTATPKQDAWQRPVYEQPVRTQVNQVAQWQGTYDAAGNDTYRFNAVTGADQRSMGWDAYGRLNRVVEGDATLSSGLLWTAVYDGLGRRVRTSLQGITNGAVSGPVLTLESYYDPQGEFLEVGVAVNGARTWKVLGPDLDGRYGSLQGIGGLEATIDETNGTVTPVVNDAFGNIVGR